jgi:hypothetical protein
MGPYWGNAYGLTQEGEGTGVSGGSVVPGKEGHKRYLEVQKKLYVEVSYVSERVTEVYSTCLMIKGNDVWMDGWMYG